VIETVVLALLFAVLLGVEWRYRLRSARIVAALIAVAALQFFEPSPRQAARRVIGAPPAERVTQWSDGRPLSDYQSGVVTMEEAVYDDAKFHSTLRLLCGGVLLWLACSPAFRRPPGDAQATGPRDQQAEG
jgi:hypothetical protein